jgi:hypothetical protein
MIKEITIKDDKVTVLYTIFKDGKEITNQTYIFLSSSFLNVASDDRAEWIKREIAKQCRRFMASEDIKNDFSTIINLSFDLDSVSYKTKADILAEAQLNVGEV